VALNGQKGVRGAGTNMTIAKGEQQHQKAIMLPQPTPHPHPLENVNKKTAKEKRASIRTVMEMKMEMA